MKPKTVELAKVFYMTEFMLAYVNKSEYQFVHSMDRLREDLKTFHKAFCSKVADIFYDYLILATAKELCYSWEHNYYCPETLVGYPIEIARSKLWGEIHKLDVRAYCDMAMNVYYNNCWERGSTGRCCFGGPLWGDGVYAISCKGVWADNIWIDHVIDLQHNSGSIFNKSSPYLSNWGIETLKYYLNVKTRTKNEWNLFETLMVEAIKSSGNEYRTLIRRFINSYAVPGQKHRKYYMDITYDGCFSKIREDCIDLLNKYEPVKYTGEFSRYKIIDSDIVRERMHVDDVDDVYGIEDY